MSSDSSSPAKDSIEEMKTTPEKENPKEETNDVKIVSPIQQDTMVMEEKEEPVFSMPVVYYYRPVGPCLSFDANNELTSNYN